MSGERGRVSGRLPGERAFRLVLRLHPRAFRRRYEEELIECYRDGWQEEAEGRGLRGMAGYWMRAAAGTVVVSWRQWRARDGTVGGGRDGRGGWGAWGRWRDARWQDLRYAGRALRRRPGFAAALVLTLGLPIGAATAVFAVVDGVLLRPLPYPSSDRLYRIAQDGDDGSYWLSEPNYGDLKSGLASFESMGAFAPDGANMVVDGAPARVGVTEADAAFFETLGIEPVVGRVFSEEERAAGAPLAVISHALWRQRMGSRPDAIGATLVLDGMARQVIGVLPPGPVVPAGTDVWTPLVIASPEWRTRRGIAWIQVIGRLRPGVGLDVARQEARALSASLRASYPDVDGRLEIGFRSLEEATIGAVRADLRVLMIAVVLVLLVAATNVGGLLLAGASAREEEMAVRTALGGGRRRLLAQLLTESVLIASLGCVLGVGIGRLFLGGLLAGAPAGTPRLDEVSLGGGAIRFALSAGIGAALVFGVLPALTALRPGSSVLGAVRTPGRRGPRLRGGLVVAQVTLALALLSAAGLLGKSFWRMRRADLGFRPDSVLVAGIPIGDHDFDSAEARETWYRAILERVRALPGVREAALTSSAPFNGFGVVFGYDLPDDPAGPGESRMVRYRVVTPELFATLGIPLLRGHTFAPDEMAGGGRPGVVVSEDLVRRHFGDADPLGRRLETAGDTFTIVGVVPSIRDVSARAESPFPFAYVPVMPATRQSMTLVVRAAVRPASLVGPVRRAVHELAPTQPVTPLRPLPELIADAAARSRFTLQLLVFFAVVTLLLAGVGLYGLLAHAVLRRTHEIGLRVALGAPTSSVRRMVVRQGLGLAAVGCVFGLGLASWAGRFLAGMLFGVRPRDPVILATVAVTLLAAALLAAWIPARRATRIAPMDALRAD